jgi:hypothetical protein
MSRLKQLQARRRVLLERCDEQREELAVQLRELEPASLLRGAGGVGGALAGLGLRHPLAWAVALGGLLFLGRTREVLTFVLWVRSALSLAARAAQLVRAVMQLRAPRAGGGD